MIIVTVAATYYGPVSWALCTRGLVGSTYVYSSQASHLVSDGMRNSCLSGLQDQTINPILPGLKKESKQENVSFKAFSTSLLFS